MFQSCLPCGRRTLPHENWQGIRVHSRLFIQSVRETIQDEMASKFTEDEPARCGAGRRMEAAFGKQEAGEQARGAQTGVPAGIHARRDQPRGSAERGRAYSARPPARHAGCAGLHHARQQRGERPDDRNRHFSGGGARLPGSQTLWRRHRRQRGRAEQAPDVEPVTAGPRRTVPRCADQHGFSGRGRAVRTPDGTGRHGNTPRSGRCGAGKVSA